MKRPIRLAAFFVTATVVALLAWHLLSPRITVMVMNATDEALPQVVVKYSGGASTIIGLAPGERKAISFVPAAASRVDLEISRAGGRVERRRVDTYFEPGYRGNLEVTLNPNLVVTSTESITAN